ncbi:MAG: potassium channel family protein [Thermoleophilia bacterium]
MTRRSAEALATYERRTGLPLFVVSLLYLIVVLVEMLPGMGSESFLLLIDGLLWAVFAVDYLYRVLLLAPDPWAYARTPLCLLDLVVVLSFPLLLVLGSAFLGLARVARVVNQVIRFTRAGAQAGRAVGQARRSFSRRSLRWVLPLALVVVVVAAASTWRFEIGTEGASIHSLGDALWWAMATMTTVGYGDVVPQSTEGRIAGVVLMLVGITVFGWLTAALASLFVERDEAAVDEELHRKLDEVSARLARMEERLDAQRRDQGPDSLG